MNKKEIIKKLRDMAKYPTVTLPRDTEALRNAADLLEQAEQDWSMLEAMKGSLREHMARIKELESQLAQQAEPDYYGLTKDHLWMSITKDHYDRLKPEFRMACYTSPPPRQPLTDEEIAELWLDIQVNTPASGVHEEGLQPWRFARAIEAAHGIKENT